MLVKDNQSSHNASDSFEQEEIRQRGRKILKSYIVVPFTDKFGYFASKWKVKTAFV
ncbi:hypothetical protein L4C39_10100 [Vibrio clamense]|uniref:hypothetical protein n=1 Tax=Vibrio clamense TaxID=2910254 RepID=UPI003D20F426